MDWGNQVAQMEDLNEASLERAIIEMQGFRLERTLVLNVEHSRLRAKLSGALASVLRHNRPKRPSPASKRV